MGLALQLGWNDVRLHAMSALTRALSVDQEVRVRALIAEPALERSPRAARRRTLAGLASVLGADAALVTWRTDTWVALADSGLTRPLPSAADPAWDSLLALLRAGVAVRGLWRAAGAEWTVIPLETAPAQDGPATALLVAGDWRRSLPALERLAREFTAVLQVRTTDQRARLHARVHRLTRELGKRTAFEEIGAAVLKHVVKAVPSRFAAFAVPSEQGDLQIVATHGYPVALVRDVRIAPGTGVIGEVFERRATLCVRDITDRPGLQRRRPRYRTNSFLAVPVLSGSTVLGVVCVTDRLDSLPFDRQDASALRALLAPAALAMARASAEQQAHRFAHAATIDPVSGLFNRRYFHARLEEELERSVRQQTPVALLMIDMDDFKRINDQYGHPAGDAVIRQVSEIIRRSVRLFDICTRFGGEEFAVLMPAADPVNALRVAERIRQHIARHQPVGEGLEALKLTVSIGMAVATSRSAQELIDAADRTLYRAKRAGKDRVEQNIEPRTSRPGQNSQSSQIMEHENGSQS
jgi:diguanylate cyclase (GGDEF)-like protein